MNFLNSLNELTKNDRICLYGAGGVGKIFLDILKQYRPDVNVIYFVDTYKKGTFCGKEIVSFTELHNRKSEIDRILITSFEFWQIAANLDKHNINNYNVVNPTFFDSYTEEEFKKVSTYIKKVKDILLDNSDKQLYEMLMNHRRICSDKSMFFKLYSWNDPKQYMEFINARTIHTIIDAGVGDGLEIMKFLDKLPNIKYIYGFEPHFDMYKAGKFYSELSVLDNVKVYPLALWNESKNMKLAVGYMVSKIVEESIPSQKTIDIETITLDEFVRKEGIKIDFIKIDTEGAERQVIEGSYKTLTEQRPQLAVCIYHSKEDMYVIPLKLSELLQDYILRIGHYSPIQIETVLYAIPKEVYYL
ncbi:MAG: FkbM family methyltransferase [Candidatus Hydrogenedentota bacterium]